MTLHIRSATFVVVLSILALIPLHAQTNPPADRPVKGASMSVHATGPFDVKLTPQDDKFEPAVGRMTIDKQFHGDLEAASKGQMISTMGTVKGSAGYVAIEI